MHSTSIYEFFSFAQLPGDRTRGAGSDKISGTTTYIRAIYTSEGGPALLSVTYLSQTSYRKGYYA